MIGEQVLSHRFLDFSRFETVNSPKWMFQKQSRCAGAQCDSQVTHRASIASLKKPSSESNNGGREDCCPLKARLCVGSGAFFCHVLRILLSEFDDGPNKPSLGIMKDPMWSACLLLS